MSRVITSFFQNFQRKFYFNNIQHLTILVRALWEKFRIIVINERTGRQSLYNHLTS